MNSKMKQMKAMSMLISLLLVGLIMLNGCKKSEPETAEPSGTETVQAALATIEQTTCPVMAGAINKELYTEYKGKKVYFCCPGCKEKFEEEPEKYIAKLPQFNK